jgi:hypothetical protein
LEKQIANYLAKLPGALPVDIIDGTAILKSIEAQHSILVERAQGIYSFSHLTFQEYLTARYLTENRNEESIFSLISRHLTDQRWREIFLLTASLLNDADYFVTSMCDTISHLFSNAPKLCHLLIWAYDRTINSNASVERRVIVQLAYLSLLLSLDRSMARYRANCLELERSRESERYSETAIFGEVDRAFARSLDRKSAHERERDRERTYERALTQVLTKVHMFWNSLLRTYPIDFDLDSEGVSTRTHNIDQALVCANSLAQNLAIPVLGFDYGLYYAWAYANLFSYENVYRQDKNWQLAMSQFPNLIQGVATLADNAGLFALAQHLRSINIPLPSASWQSWQKYSDTLFAFLRNERDFDCKREFSQEEIIQLNNYFYGNELIVQCLNVAAISDRARILRSLLLRSRDIEKDEEIEGLEENWLR